MKLFDRIIIILVILSLVYLFLQILYAYRVSAQTSSTTALQGSFTHLQYESSGIISPTYSNAPVSLVDGYTSIYAYSTGLSTPLPSPKPQIKYGAFKSYMDYRTITDSTSKQYELQSRSRTGKHGIRTIDGRYAIAIGTGWRIDVGTKVVVELDNGKLLECIVADIKDDAHTDSINKTRETYTSDGKLIRNAVEFVVCEQSLSDIAKLMGDISYADEAFEGEVVDVREDI